MARQQARDNVVTAARPVADNQIDLLALVEILHRRLGARGDREDARGAQQGNDSPRRELAPLTRPRSRSAPSPLVGEGWGGGRSVMLKRGQRHRTSRRDGAEPLEVRPLLLAARRQLE